MTGGRGQINTAARQQCYRSPYHATCYLAKYLLTITSAENTHIEPPYVILPDLCGGSCGEEVEELRGLRR